MIIDYRSGECPRDLEVDLCIIGGGPAGIAIARTFIGTSFEVCLLESGGHAGDRPTQELCNATSVGLPFNSWASRMRILGGSSTLWGGACLPLGELDLIRRPWVPHSGWPISFDELRPYYARARTFCRIDGTEFTEGSFRTPLMREPLTFDAHTLVNQIVARSPIVFGAEYRAELERAPNVTVFLHANVLDLEATPDGASVREARVASLGGQRGAVRARQYVLACGGIENARQLLLSSSVVPNGLGNQNDRVGRFFMDHPACALGTVHGGDSRRITYPYDHDLRMDPRPPTPEIGLASAIQTSQRTLHGRVHPFPVEAETPTGIRALRDLRAALRSSTLDEGASLEADLLAVKLHHTSRADRPYAPAESIGRLALRLGLNIGDLARAFVKKARGKPAVTTSHVELLGYFEQAPNPDSRVTLSDEKDALGQRKACIDWRLTPLDLHTYRSAAALFGHELARACHGRFELDPALRDEATPQVNGTAHHMGTTRMSDDPREGVVDRDCKVHGMANLHIAGSSVFPTGGWAMPTFTIVALSLRLADRLRELPAHDALPRVGAQPKK